MTFAHTACLILAFALLSCSVPPLPPQVPSGSRLPELRYQVAQAKASTVAVAFSGQVAQDGRPTVLQNIVVGSGVAVAHDRVLTCAHVVGPLAPNVSITVARDAALERLGDAAVFFPASIVNRDTEHDLALLSVPGLDADPVAIGSPGDVDVGDDVFFIGHPSVAGIAPALGTAVVAAKEFVRGDRVFRLDGSVNSGNRGGALVSRLTGKLVGIINAKAGGLTGELKLFRDTNPSVALSIGGYDPIAVLRATLTEMERNLQLGIGYAIRVEEVGPFLHDVR